MRQAPATPMQVADHLSALGLRLDELVNEINAADAVYVAAKEKYTQARAVAYRHASGTGPAREALATETTHLFRLAAEEAELRVRQLRRQIDAIKIRIDIGRSFGAAIRAEMEVLKTSFGP